MAFVQSKQAQYGRFVTSWICHTWERRVSQNSLVHPLVKEWSRCSETFRNGTKGFINSGCWFCIDPVYLEFNAFTAITCTGILHMKTRFLNYITIHEKQLAVAHLNSFKLQQATLTISLYLNDICRRKWRSHTQWQQPFSWWDQHWYTVNFNLLGGRIGSEYANFNSLVSYLALLQNLCFISEMQQYIFVWRNCLMILVWEQICISDALY